MRLEKLVALMDVPKLRAEIAARGVGDRRLGLGCGLRGFTATGPEGYGRAGVPVSAVDTVTVTLGPEGDVAATASVSEIGQGIRQSLAQVIADAVGAAGIAGRRDVGRYRRRPAWRRRVGLARRRDRRRSRVGRGRKLRDEI